MSGPPINTKTQRCSSSFQKMAWTMQTRSFPGCVDLSVGNLGMEKAHCMFTERTIRVSMDSCSSHLCCSRVTTCLSRQLLKTGNIQKALGTKPRNTLSSVIGHRKTKIEKQVIQLIFSYRILKSGSKKIQNGHPNTCKWVCVFSPVVTIFKDNLHCQVLSLLLSCLWPF